MKAKDVSLKTIVLAIVWVAVLVLAKAFAPVVSGRALGISIEEILLSGAFFVVACTPVYRSIWLDKKLGISTDSKEAE